MRPARSSPISPSFLLSYCYIVAIRILVRVRATCVRIYPSRQPHACTWLALCFNNSPLSPSAQISSGAAVFSEPKTRPSSKRNFSHVHPSKSPAVSHPIYPSIGFTFLLLLQLFFFLLRLRRSLAASLLPHYGIIFFDFPPESRFFYLCFLHIKFPPPAAPGEERTPTVGGRHNASGRSDVHVSPRETSTPGLRSLTHTHSTDLAAHRRWPVRLQWHWKNSRVFLLPVVLLCYVRRRPLAQFSSRRPQLHRRTRTHAEVFRPEKYSAAALGSEISICCSEMDFWVTVRNCFATAFSVSRFFFTFHSRGGGRCSLFCSRRPCTFL